MNVEKVVKFIAMRHSIYMLRKAGAPPPWTDDPILQAYRFCNVYRELDKVTLWISDNLRIPNRTDPDNWFAMVIARFINHPDTLKELGYPVPFDPKWFVKVCARRKKAGEQVYTGAYMVRADAHADGSKASYLASKVFKPLWAAREKVRPQGVGEPLQAFYDRLRQFRDMGSFMAAQVVADVKLSYSPDEVPDWWTFAASGPGSRRGLNRILGRDFKAPWVEEEWKAKLLELRDEVNLSLAKLGMCPLCAQNMQNSLCETDKYERVRLGQGRPRSRYRYPVISPPELFSLTLDGTQGKL